MEIFVSLSALPPSQYRKYRKGWKPNPTLLGLFEKISGKKGHKAMRIYIDAKTDSVIKNIAQNVKPPIQIVDALAEKHIVLVDYVAGTGKDTHGRIIKLGKALAKDAELKKMFDSDPNRKAIVNATRNRQLICISMHPYDIAGMSTDRGWSSCMHLKTGSNKKFVKQDIAGGTLIAYLIDQQDKNIGRPIARCLAKPFFEKAKVKAADKFVGSDKVNALYLVEFAYPDSKMPFVHTFQAWLDEHINPSLATTERKGIYTLHNKLYADQRGSEFDYDIETPIMRGDVDAFVQRLIKDKYTSRAEDIVMDYLDRYPNIAVLLAQQKWGKPNSRFYSRCVSEFVNSENYPEMVNFLNVVFKQFSLDGSEVESIWNYLSGKPKSLAMFINALPKERRDAFLASRLKETDLYNDRDDALVNGAYPSALSEIWQFAKYSPDPENLFWFNAGRINTAGTRTSYVDEEFGSDSNSDYREYVLCPAVASLANQDPKCPAATLAGLKRNKAAVSNAYYLAAQRVFAGEKFIEIRDEDRSSGLSAKNNRTRSLRNNLRQALREHKKPKITESEVTLLLHRIGIDMLIGQAAEELYPDAYNLTRSGVNMLMDTPLTVQQIKETVYRRAEEIGMAAALEELINIREEAKARRARLKAQK